MGLIDKVSRLVNTHKAPDIEKNEFRIQNLKVWYHQESNKALDDLSLNISNENINIILGHNGSGKSSLLRCLAGHQQWNSGEIFWNGRSRAVDVKDFNKDLIFISEDLIIPSFEIHELAIVYKEIWPGFVEADFKRILSWGEINPNKKFHQLSRGQRILLQFALSIATRCKTVLIDEVTAALDPYIRSKVADELLTYHRDTGALIVFATNIATEFKHESTNLILIKSGKLYLEGKFSEIKPNLLK